MSIAMAAQHERRLFPRLQFKNKSLVLADDVVGLVRDVSLGGISFSYYEKDGKGLGDRGFDIVSGTGAFSVLAGDYEIIPEPNEFENGCRGERMVCCRLRFLNISAAHLAGLWSFLKEQSLPIADSSSPALDGSAISFAEIETFVSANRQNLSLKRDKSGAPFLGNVEQIKDYGCLQKETCVVV